MLKPSDVMAEARPRVSSGKTWKGRALKRWYRGPSRLNTEGGKAGAGGVMEFVQRCCLESRRERGRAGGCKPGISISPLEPAGLFLVSPGRLLILQGWEERNLPSRGIKHVGSSPAHSSQQLPRGRRGQRKAKTMSQNEFIPL